jgi:membrane protein
VREAWERFSTAPAVLHVRRAQRRYRDRMGSESGAAMAFFSILTVIPTLVFIAMGAGLVLTIIRPDLLAPVQNWLGHLLGSFDTSETIVEKVTATVWDWNQDSQQELRQVVLLLGSAVVLVGYSGGNWLRHLRRALNMIWRLDADDVETKSFVVWRWAKNIGQFLVFACLVLLSLATATLATSFTAWLLTQLGIDHSVGGVSLLRLAAVASSLIVSWTLFVYVLRIIPSYRQPFGSIAQGALMGAVAWFAVQQASSLLIRFFARGQTASVFGPVFVVLLVFNVFSQMTLFVAAWTATAGHPLTLKKVRAPRPDKEIPALAQPGPDESAP